MGIIQISFTSASCCKLKAGTARLMHFVPGSSNIISGEGKVGVIKETQKVKGVLESLILQTIRNINLSIIKRKRRV